VPADSGFTLAAWCLMPLTPNRLLAPPAAAGAVDTTRPGVRWLLLALPPGLVALASRTAPGLYATAAARLPLSSLRALPGTANGPLVGEV
jgi:hypothetical protein